MNANVKEHRALLQSIARRAMLERGLLPDFSAEALAELGKIQSPATADESVRDLTNLLWASIDNDDSRDLDQLTVAEALPGDKIKPAGGYRRCGLARQKWIGHRRSRAPQYDLGVYRGHDLPHAA